MSKKFDYVLGLNKYDCGIASIMTILLYYGIKPSREEIISKYKKTDNGYTAYDLVKIANSYGISSYGIKSNIKDINKFPVIAHIIKNKDMFHFIVILEKKGNNLIIMDPSEGIVNMTAFEFNKVSTNIFLIFSGEKSKSKKNIRFKKEIIRIFHNNKRIILKTVLFSIINIFLSLIFNYYLKLMLSYNNKKSLLLIIFMLFFYISIAKNSINYFKNHLTYNVSKKIDKDINEQITTHIFKLPYEYFNSKTTGELLTIIEDIEYFKEVITKVFISSQVNLILIVLILVYFSFISPYISLILFILIIIMLFITKNFQYAFNNGFTKYKKDRINYNTTLIDFITSFQTIKNLFIHDKITNVLKSKYTDSLNSDKMYNKVFLRYDLLGSLLIDIFYVFIIFVFLLYNDTSNSLYNVILFSSVYYLIIGLLNNINESISMYKVYQSSTDRILDCLYVKEEDFKETNLNSISKIEFRDVNYRIENINVLSNINLTIENNDKVFITGESGIGKSTLMKLLLRYFTPNEGSILIDGLNIKDLDLTFLRNNITYISQNESIFIGSILDNLRLVSSSLEEIDMASNITLFDEYLSKNGIDYNFLLDEFGNNISGGERKKLILTRGLLHFKNVLVLDEVFNEISIKEERKILDNLFKKYNDKIIIVISHRNNNQDLFNKKYKIEGDGRIYEIE